MCTHVNKHNITNWRIWATFSCISVLLMTTEVVTEKQANPGNLWKNIHCHIAIKTEVENKFSHESTEKLFGTTRKK